MLNDPVKADDFFSTSSSSFKKKNSANFLLKEIGTSFI